MTIASRFISVDGIRTHYLEAGEGPTVVLLHSGEFGASAEISWEYNIEALAKHFHVIAPDWLGYGKTDKVHDFTSGFVRRLGHMRRFLEVMCIDKADFVGNSMGGTFLMRVLSMNPNAFPVRSLTAVSSGGFNPMNDARRAMVDYDCTREAMRANVDAMFHDPKWANDAAYIEKRFETSIMPGAWECAAAARFKNPLVPPLPEYGLPDPLEYEKLNLPILLIIGANDKLREPGYGSKLAARIKGVEYHELQNCGHCANIEQAETFNRLTIDFIKKQQEAK